MELVNYVVVLVLIILAINEHYYQNNRRDRSGIPYSYKYIKLIVLLFVTYYLGYFLVLYIKEVWM